jgi:hypothetical protein
LCIRALPPSFVALNSPRDKSVSFKVPDEAVGMTRRKRWFQWLLGAVVAVPVLLFLSLWLYFRVTFRPSRIADFHPTNFRAKAGQEFFYSIGDALKYSDEINPEASTLFRGQISRFLVSPDSKRIAVVANSLLMVISIESPIIRKVAAVDSIYRDPKPIGQQFFRDDDFQWSRDSKGLYLIKDEYYVVHPPKLDTEGLGF